MRSLAAILLLCTLPSVLEAFCYVKGPINLKAGFKAPTHCQDETDGTWHAVGSTWINSKCLRCDCTECCSVYSVPTNFPDDCVSEFDSKSCKYKVFKKNDTSIECPIFAAVGK